MPENNTGMNIENIPAFRNAFIRLDNTGKMVQANDAAAVLLGYPVEHLKERFIWEVTPASIVPRLRQELGHVISGQMPTDVQAYDARLGSWIEYHMCPSADGINLQIMDITARQRTANAGKDSRSSREQQLEEQIRLEVQEKDRLRILRDDLEMALAAAHMATWELDLISGELSCSESIREVIGVPPEAAPHSIKDLLPWFAPGDFEEHRARVETAVTSGEEYVSEVRMRNPVTGEVRWFENRGRTQRDDQLRPIRVHGILQDITRRKSDQIHLEHQVQTRTAELDTVHDVLRESEERVRMVLKKAPIAMSMVDRDLCFKWFYHPLIPHAEQYIGKTVEAFLSPGEAAEVNGLRRQVLETGTGARKELWHVIAGRRVCYDMLMEPLRNEAGEIQGITTVALDVTERKKSEERLQSLNSALERRAEELRNLSVELTRVEERERRRIAGVLHDTLQPLLVGAKFIAESSLEKESNERMQTGLEKIKDILNESIATTRSLTAELAPPILYQQGLPGALKWLADWMLEKYGLHVTVASDQRKEEVAQELRVVLFQAVRELLFNVAKHAQVKEAVVTLCYAGQDTIAVRVRDEGRGFNPAVEKTSGRIAGGFGLTAVRERLAAMGGTMEIESTPSQGTTTMIKVPVRLERS